MVCVQRPWHEYGVKSVEGGRREFKFQPFYTCTPNAACLCGIRPVCVLLVLHA